MINGFYLQKKDIIDVHRANTPMIITDPKITTEIMNGVTSKKQLIQKIEKYNDDHKLSLTKRIPYSLQIGTSYICVLKAYFQGDAIIVVGWDQTGHPRTQYTPNMKLKEAMSAVSTHLCDEKDISDINLGGYDMNILPDIDENESNLKDRELKSVLSDILATLNSLYGSGLYRSLIHRFNIDFKNFKLNDITYEFQMEQYDLYLKCFTIYIQTISEIYNFYIDPVRNNKYETYKRFHFFDTEENRKKEIEKHEKEALREYNCTEENSFTNDEIEMFNKIINET